MPANRKLLQISSTVVILAMMFSGIHLSAASAQGKDGIRRQFNVETGRVSFIGPESGRRLPASEALGISALALPANPALALARRFGPEFGLRDPERELTQMQTKHPGNGRLTVRYQQNYQGIPVIGGELLVNTNENGDLYSINGEVSSDISLQTQPTIESEKARGSVLQNIAKWYGKTPADFIASEPELWIYDESLLRPGDRPAELVWRLEVTSTDKSVPVRELVLVDAQRGNISLHFNQMDNAWSVSTPGKPNIALSTNSNETSLLIGTSATHNGTFLALGSPLVNTYTANSSTSLPGTLLCNQTKPNCTNNADPQADAAHKYAIGTYNLYASQYGRDSIDNNGMIITSTVHYCGEFECPYANAFWDGTQMVYGDAYGFAVADDVVAHELTHGVTQNESNLFYFYQSGAINESFSDLWGEYYDQTNGLGNDSADVKWQIGEDISGLGAIRHMSNPAAFDNPDKISSANYYEEEGDNGGVHINSGVNNKAVFLMVDGGSFNGETVSALGWVKTSAIYYEANTSLLSSGADYSDLYYALQQACSNLIGQKGITSANCQEVKDAVDAVEMNSQPAPNFNTDAPLCGTGDALNVIFADDLEAGTSNWTFTNGAHPRWQYDSADGPYAQSGLHSLYAADYPDTVSDARARLVSFTVPNNAYLNFAQAYDFEAFFGNYYDGGALEYSINGGSTWVDAGSLINFNGYTGMISNDWSNPLKGRSAFVGSSHGYISTRVNLASLAGNNVTFRWRMGLDDFGYSWGWWVDNIKVYTCAVPNVDVLIGGTLANSYFVPASGSDRVAYAGVNNGPVKIVSTNSSSIFAAERVIYNVNGVPASFSEMMALPNNQLSTIYWLPWYNNVDLDTQLRFGNVSSSTGTVSVYIGDSFMGDFNLTPGKSTRVSFAGVNNGPVKIVSNVNIVAAERVIYKVNGAPASFSEMVALSNNQLSTIYWLPWYNNVDLDTQLRFGNVSGSTASVNVYIGGTLMDGSPFSLAPGESTRVSFTGVNNGPVKIVSNVNIVAAERVIYNVNGGPTSFSEMMALPNSQLNTTYWLPWYNNVDLDTQLRFGNVSGSTATVHVFIAGAEMISSPFSLAPGESTRVSFTGVNNGPVKIVSNVNIVAAERVIYNVNNSPTSFSEMMALPNNQLSTIYWLPWYNNVDLDTQLRFGRP